VDPELARSCSKSIDYAIGWYLAAEQFIGDPKAAPLAYTMGELVMAGRLVVGWSGRAKKGLMAFN
jgi:hypothetical protein